MYFKSSESSENIVLTYKEIVTDTVDPDFEEIINGLIKLQDELNNINTNTNTNTNNISLIIEEIQNYTVKQLMVICDYYNISKNIKLCKLKKQDIIETIITFELDHLNTEIVNKRKIMWNYLNELKNDKMMKQFIIW